MRVLGGAGGGPGGISDPAGQERSLPFAAPAAWRGSRAFSGCSRVGPPLSQVSEIPLASLPQRWYAPSVADGEAKPTVSSASPLLPALQFWESTSLSSLDTSGIGSGSSSASSSSVSSTPVTASRTHKRSVSGISSYSSLSLPLYNQQVDDCCIIRVSLAVDNGNMYKSILVRTGQPRQRWGGVLAPLGCGQRPVLVMVLGGFAACCTPQVSNTLCSQVTSQDKTPVVIRKAMAKHNLDGDRPEDYELVQIISEERGVCWGEGAFLRAASSASPHHQIGAGLGGVSKRSPSMWGNSLSHSGPFSDPHPWSLAELKIPDNANVFYAMNSAANYDFVLKKRGFSKGVKIKHGSSSTLPRMKQKGLKIAKGIF